MELSLDKIDAINNSNDFREIFEAGLSLAASDKSRSKELIEIAAKEALKQNELEFAQLALFSINEV